MRVIEQPITGLSESNSVVISHNLGYAPMTCCVKQVINGNEVGFTRPPSGFFGIYVSEVTDQTITVKQDCSVNISGSLKLICFDGGAE
jgi:hypothetical protein